MKEAGLTCETGLFVLRFSCLFFIAMGGTNSQDETPLLQQFVRFNRNSVYRTHAPETKLPQNLAAEKAPRPPGHTDACARAIRMSLYANRQ